MSFFLRLLVLLCMLTGVVCPAAAEELTGICITEISDSSLTLGSRILRPGDVLTAQQAEAMTVFGEVEVGYLPIYRDSLGEETAMTLSNKNKAPIAEDSALETYKNLPNSGRLKVRDPEEAALTLTLVRPPRRGSVELHPDGSFTYTPKKHKVGVDSFTYTATDPAGNVSREATVTVTILKPTDSRLYTDTLGLDCRFAAEWMRQTGIFTGETVADATCFRPEAPVTRGQFVTMLVKALDIPAQDTLECSGYTDDIPSWLKPYLAAAFRSGLTAGLESQTTFGAAVQITDTEAAQMLENALDTPVFSQLTGEVLTRSTAAQILYNAVKIQEAQKIDTVI